MEKYRTLNKIVLGNSSFSELGVVFTKSEIVEGMLDLLNYRSDRDLSQIRILEPSAGDGAFALKIIQRLLDSSKKIGFSLDQALSNVVLYEIDPRKANTLCNSIRNLFASYGVRKDPNELIIVGDFLLAEQQRFDIIIGNPPYLRWEYIPVSMRTTYKKIFKTFIDRCDLYIPFFEKGLQLLKPSGKLSFICSNRWFKTKYGKGLRDLISKLYYVNNIIDLDKTDAFKQKVTAYPSIITISNNQSSGTTFFYKSNSLENFKNISYTGLDKIPGIARLPKNDIWLNSLRNELINSPSLEPIENQGFKIGIGVATGRDKVFIGEDLEIEDELLIPIITAKELKSDKFQKSQKRVINPFDESGKLIDLKEYPKANAYFTQFEKELSNRHIAKKNPLAWYRTIDKINPQLVKVDKILLPDITGNKKIFIDRGNYYPHHNLYYIIGNSFNDLKVLASILMSDFVFRQLKILSSNMNGGYPRWQSQNLRRLQLPIISALKPDYYKNLLSAYDKQDLPRINQLVSLAEIENNVDQSRKWTLFDSEIKYK